MPTTISPSYFSHLSTSLIHFHRYLNSLKLLLFPTLHLIILNSSFNTHLSNLHFLLKNHTFFHLFISSQALGFSCLIQSLTLFNLDYINLVLVFLGQRLDPFFQKKLESLNMGKQGPCSHCGVPSTPVWRNGPPEKPVLCNACGSRWRTKGSLTNYTPLHARAEPEKFINNKASRIKIISGRDKEMNLLKRKQVYENVVIGNFASNYSDSFWKVTDNDDTSNRSSSGSVVSNAESYAQFDTSYVSELTGYSHSFAIDTKRTNPAKKRVSIPHPKSSSIASLTKDLCTILQHQQSSGIYRPEDDDLLFESDKSIFSSETGHGSYLIKERSSITRDEDSETSSFSVDT